MEVPYVNLTLHHSPIKSELLSAVSRVIDHGIFIMGRELDDLKDDIEGNRSAIEDIQSERDYAKGG